MISVLFFGTNFVPVKKYDPADGMFFQWIMCVGIFLVGFITTWIRTPQGESIEFYPFALLGGFLWCTGNIMTVPTVKLIGLGLGILIWGLSNLAMGWFTGTFGLFGTEKGDVKIPALNYVGFCMACFSMGVFAFVKPSTDSDKPTTDESANLLHLQASSTSSASAMYDVIDGSVGDKDGERRTPGIDVEKFLDRVFGEKKRFVGYGMALVMGLFFGNNFTPSAHMINHACKDGVLVHSTHGLHYVFSQFTGILLTSTIYFSLYCIVTKNNPAVNPQIVFPALISGIMWAIAQVFFFVANSQLGLNVAFPIVALGPGIVASLIGILVYKEIQGRNNLIVFFVAFSIAVVAIIMITLSKIA
jgi:glucose uptake protein GlcU